MDTRNLLFDVGALPYAFLTAQPVWRAHGGELASFAELRAGDRVLDLGCGPGESAFGMIDRVPGIRVVGLDRSPMMIALARARRRFDRAGNSTEFVQGDAMELPFESGSFDAVTGHSFLYLVPDAKRVLREAARVLRKGGRCVFLEPAGRRGVLVPRAIAVRAFREPRFVTSMQLWRLVSRGYGRFDRARFESLFEEAGLTPIRIVETLSGLGYFGIGEKR